MDVTANSVTPLTCVLYRLDTTLVDFSDMRWERGDLTFLFNGRAKPTNSLVVMDNQLKVYQMVSVNRHPHLIS